MDEAKPGRVIIDSRQFLLVEGTPVCRIVCGRLQFVDKDRRRSSARGTRLVEVSLQELMMVLEPQLENGQ